MQGHCNPMSVFIYFESVFSSQSVIIWIWTSQWLGFFFSKVMVETLILSSTLHSKSWWLWSDCGALKMLFVRKPDTFCIPCKLRVCKFPKNSMDVNYMYHCHPYHFMEICKPPVNEPIGSYQIHHLNLDMSNCYWPLQCQMSLSQGIEFIVSSAFLL